MTADFKPGDRVWVDDSGLAELRRIMRRYGHDPAPNHTGVVHEIEDDDIYIIFDDTKSMGIYSAHEVHHGEPEVES